MVTKAELYFNMLKELESAASDIISSAIVTLDGLTMASTAKDSISKDTLAAYTAAAYRRATDSMLVLTDERVDLLIFESKNHRVISIIAGNDALLITLTGRNVEIGIVISELHKAAEKFRRLL